jgi:hypothetical protein
LRILLKVSPRQSPSSAIFSSISSDGDRPSDEPDFCIFSSYGGPIAADAGRLADDLPLRQRHDIDLNPPGTQPLNATDT